MKILLIFTAFLVSVSGVSGQQRADIDFNPVIKTPAYDTGEGPVIFLDEAHNNFHTLKGRYSPFARLLGRDGYILESSLSEITEDILKKCRIFVISVPMSKESRSAYTKKEIQILKKWVKDGGSLFLITDHFPDPPAISELATAFGIKPNNSYVLNSAPNEEVGPIYFKRQNKTLANHPVTNGRDKAEKVNSVTTFTGCAFQAGPDFFPILTFGPYKVSWFTKEQDKFPPDTPKKDVEGWLQGGVMEFGKGRLAFFAEAAMFTAQVMGPRRMKFGMNSLIAPENVQFLLNIIHWLSGII